MHSSFLVYVAKIDRHWLAKSNMRNFKRMICKTFVLLSFYHLHEDLSIVLVQEQKTLLALIVPCGPNPSAARNGSAPTGGFQYSELQLPNELQLRPHELPLTRHELRLRRMNRPARTSQQLLRCTRRSLLILQSSVFIYFYFTGEVFSFRMTSCAPPSTILVEETSVRTAFSCSSSIESAPQLHIVDLTFESDKATLSLRDPA